MALSTIGTNAITDATIATGDIADGAVTFGKVDATSTEANNLKQRVCKAWLHMNGTGTAQIDDDFNVASITDHGTADYTATYSTAMGSTEYVVAGSVVGSTASNHYSFITADGSNLAATGTRFSIYHHSGSYNDMDDISLLIFGDS